MKSIHVIADTLPEAWEQAVLECWKVGEPFPTEYDKPGDPNSRDVTAIIHIRKPMADPRLHRCFPGGLADLEKYRAEVLYGVHNHWVDPAAGKWEYTYHQRLFRYEVACPTCGGAGWQYATPASACAKQVCQGCGGKRKIEIDQIFGPKGVVEKLKAAPHSRRAQAVTWQVWKDMGISDPSCLQRMWFRCQRVCADPDTRDRLLAAMLIDDEVMAAAKDQFDTGVLPQDDYENLVQQSRDRLAANRAALEAVPYKTVLNMNIHIRSNDAWKAGFMNMYAFIELQAMVAAALGVEVGEYIHVADSFHIYGSYFDQFETMLRMSQRPWEEKTWTMAFARDHFIEGCEQLLREPDLPGVARRLVLNRVNELVAQAV